MNTIGKIASISFVVMLVMLSFADEIKMRRATSSELKNMEIRSDTNDQTHEGIVRDVFNGIGRFKVYNGNKHFRIRKMEMEVRRYEYGSGRDDVLSEDTHTYSAEVSVESYTTASFTISMPPVGSLHKGSTVAYEIKTYSALGEDDEIPNVVDSNGDVIRTVNVERMEGEIKKMKKALDEHKVRLDEHKARVKQLERDMARELTPRRVKVVYCSNCGRKLNARWKFCVDCGTRVVTGSTNVITRTCVKDK